MKNVATLILGGGRGTRLYPLTRYRSKPAVPLAGKYRLIDIPISNCINSGLRRIYVLTQFMSVSLHRHIRNAYIFDRFSDGFVEILAAQQTIQQGDEIAAIPSNPSAADVQQQGNAVLAEMFHRLTNPLLSQRPGVGGSGDVSTANRRGS